jgi:two-component system, cell cycle sensor histidine kinase and response regulator CckA
MTTPDNVGERSDNRAPAAVMAREREPNRRAAAEIAHHLKNRLTAILGFCDLILDGDGEHVPGAWRQDVGQIRDNAFKASALVCQLLSDGVVDARTPPVLDVAVALASMAPTLRRLSGPGIHVQMDMSALGHAPVRIAPEAFEQVVLNLVSNAADASPPGGRVSVRARRIDGRAATVVIEVADKGGGIPDACRERMFEPFVTTKTNGRGTGLGLSIVREIVEAAGGTVRLDNIAGAGTMATVAFALTDAVPEAAVAAGHAHGSRRSQGTPALTHNGAGGRVLLVDDEMPTRMVAARALIRAGFQVVEAVDGGAALDALHGAGDGPDGAFDAVVSDVAMPGFDGWELAARLRERHPALPIVLTSGYEADPVDVGATGVRFLAKPFSLDALVEAVRLAVSEGGAIRARPGSDRRAQG